MPLAALRAAVKEGALRSLGSPLAAETKIRVAAKAGVLTILNLHRVSRRDGSTYEALDPGLFKYLLVFIKKRFDVVTFAELGEDRGGDRPKLILSFDDGYKDFIDVAVPLLDKHGIRVNQNVIPECIETGLPPFNVLAQDFIGRAPEAVVQGLDLPGFRFDLKADSRGALGRKLTTFIKNRPLAEQHALREILVPQIRRYGEFVATPMMSREEVRQVAAVHEIGAHSYAHASLAFETDEFVRDDIVRCRQYFSDALGQPLSIYALPNGSYRPGQLDIFRQERIQHILLVDEDYSAAGSDVYRRFTFHALSEHEVRFRVAGAARWPRAAA
jgi:peptidoglycan/xylan/chitin deacetylase (PgdA/CDA1 family)